MQKYLVLRRLGRGAGGRSLERLGIDGGERAALRLEVEELEQAQAVELRRDDDVLALTRAMPIKLIEPRSSDRSTDFSNVWGITAVGADKSSFEGAGVTVAVLDTGIDASHEAFAGVDLQERDFSGVGNGDRNGHGTHCSGTIFGRDVDGVRIGIARQVPRALIAKVLDDRGRGDSEMMFQAIQWAITERASVISMSVGFDFPGMVQDLVDDRWPVDLATSTALEAFRGNLLMFNAIVGVAQAGAPFGTDPVIIAAAGNESRRSIDERYRIAASVPAAADGVISVAALGETSGGFEVAEFSNSQAEVAAPGVGIVSAEANGRLTTMDGTSMACPHVVGVAALWCESLRQQGRRGGGASVQAKVLASATLKGIVHADEADVGLGLVQSP